MLYHFIPEPLPLPQRAAAFIDLQDNKVDQEAGSLLSHFRDQLALPRLERCGGVCKGRIHFIPLFKGCQVVKIPKKAEKGVSLQV